VKTFLARHIKSSAFLTTVIIHVILVVMATGFIAIKVFIEPTLDVRAVSIDHQRPNIPIRLRPLKATRGGKTSAPRMQPQTKRIAFIKPVNISLPPLAMIPVPLSGMNDDADAGLSIGFPSDLPFFEMKAQGEKVCYIVHFGPATIGANPYSRMTGYTIRKRLEDFVSVLPEYTLFNVACYWAGDTCAVAPDMMLATSENKQLVSSWMETVNPLEGSYDHCFDWQDASQRVRSARNAWPTRVDSLPFYSPRWVYPYEVPKQMEQKYLDDDHAFTHWGRAVAWAMLTQKPDTIFVLTTNYIDGWGNGNAGEPTKLAAGYKKLVHDIYGMDKKKWPTLNVVVLAPAGQDSGKAYNVLHGQFGPLVKAFKGEGSVIEDITEFMNTEEKVLLHEYAKQYRK